MSTPEEKLKLVREQVITKIRWGTSEEEVADWLLKKHNIAGEDAEQLLAVALRRRRHAIRERALMRIALASAGLIAVAVFIDLRFFSGIVFAGTGATLANLCALAIGLASVSALYRGILLYRAGETSGSVD